MNTTVFICLDVSKYGKEGDMYSIEELSMITKRTLSVSVVSLMWDDWRKANEIEAAAYSSGYRSMIEAIDALDTGRRKLGGLWQQIINSNRHKYNGPTLE